MLVVFIGQSIVMAHGTILPKAGEGCSALVKAFHETPETRPTDVGPTLGCAITTGRVSVAMVPYFITYFSNYLLGLVSMIALLFVVIGGVLWTVGGVSQQKEKGKAFITNALIGMVISFLAWTLVNVIISAVTG